MYIHIIIIAFNAFIEYKNIEIDIKIVSTSSCSQNITKIEFRWKLFEIQDGRHKNIQITCVPPFFSQHGKVKLCAKFHTFITF